VRGHRTLRCARLVKGVAGWRELILVGGDSPARQGGGCSSAEGVFDRGGLPVLNGFRDVQRRVLCYGDLENRYDFDLMICMLVYLLV
jgi:hypothetical protein